MRSLLALTLALAACHGAEDNPHRTPPAPMTEAAILMPIAPGKTDAWRAALEDLTGPRYDEYVASRRRYGLTAQTTFLQQTPMGDFALIHLAGPDVHAAFHQMQSSQDDWDVTWRELTLDLHGVDFARGDEVFPRVQAVFSTAPAAAPAAHEFLFAAPLGADGAEQLLAIGAELMGARHDEYVRARRAIGVEREAVFLESTARGDVAIFYWDATDPRASLAELAASDAPLDVWLRDQAAAAHPIELDAIAAIAGENVMVGQFPHR
jgi:hypothetical protein